MPSTLFQCSCFPPQLHGTSLAHSSRHHCLLLPLLLQQLLMHRRGQSTEHQRASEKATPCLQSKVSAGNKEGGQESHNCWEKVSPLGDDPQRPELSVAAVPRFC